MPETSVGTNIIELLISQNLGIFRIIPEWYKMPPLGTSSQNTA